MDPSPAVAGVPDPAAPAAGKFPVTAFVVTYNEAGNIADCLASVDWCDEIVVVDSLSTDVTVEIARRFTDRVVSRPWEGHVRQKGFAMSLARNDWVFLIDADERVSPELKASIARALTAARDGTAGFRVPRRAFHLGRWIRHGGWYPDRKLRLFRKSLATITGEDPHERVEARGAVADLDGDLLHYTYRNLSHQLRTIDFFSDIEAENFRRAGTRPGPARMLIRPLAKFLETYLLKRGFLDGMPGLIIAASTAYYVFLKYAKLWEREATGRAPTMENRS